MPTRAVIQSWRHHQPSTFQSGFNPIAGSGAEPQQDFREGVQVGV